jgi:hypothetical protein
MLPRLTAVACSALVRIPPARSPHRITENIVMSDGGSVSLDWFAGMCVGSSMRVVLLLPGLGNDSRTGFIEHCADQLTEVDPVLKIVRAEYAAAALFSLVLTMHMMNDQWLSFEDAGGVLCCDYELPRRTRTTHF